MRDCWTLELKYLWCYKHTNTTYCCRCHLHIPLPKIIWVTFFGRCNGATEPLSHIAALLVFVVFQTQASGPDATCRKQSFNLQPSTSPNIVGLCSTLSKVGASSNVVRCLHVSQPVMNQRWIHIVFSCFIAESQLVTTPFLILFMQFTLALKRCLYSAWMLCLPSWRGERNIYRVVTHVRTR